MSPERRAALVEFIGKYAVIKDEKLYLRGKTWSILEDMAEAFPDATMRDLKEAFRQYGGRGHP